MKDYCSLCNTWKITQLHTVKMTYPDGSPDEIAMCESCFNWWRQNKKMVMDALNSINKAAERG